MKGRSKNEHISLRMRKAWGLGMEKLQREWKEQWIMLLLEMLFKEPMSPVLWQWLRVSFGVGPNRFASSSSSLEQVRWFCFFNWNFWDNGRSTCSFKKWYREIPCTLCRVSPNGDVLQNYTITIRTLTLILEQVIFYFFVLAGIVWPYKIIMRKKCIKMLNIYQYCCSLLLLYVWLPSMKYLLNARSYAGHLDVACLISPLMVGIIKLYRFFFYNAAGKSHLPYIYACLWFFYNTFLEVKCWVKEYAHFKLWLDSPCCLAERCYQFSQER